MKRILAALLWLAMMGTASAGTLVTNDGSFANQTNVTQSIINFTGVGASVPINVAGMNSCQILMNPGVGNPTGTWQVLGSPDGITYGQLTSPINAAIAGLAYTSGTSLMFPLLPPALSTAGGLQFQAARSMGTNFIEINFTAFSGTSLTFTVTCTTAIMPPPAANIASGFGGLVLGDACSTSPAGSVANVVSTATLTINTITVVQANVAGTKIYVCGESGFETGTVLTAVELFSSTSATCASGNTLIQILSANSATQATWGPVWGSPIVQTNANNTALCIEALGTTSSATAYSFRLIQE